MHIIAVHFDSLTDMPIDWLFLETIGIYESPIDNMIFLMNLSGPNF